MQIQRQSLQTNSMEFPMDLDNYGTAFGREVAVAKAIFKCGKFQIEDGIVAGRVAKALDRYVFLVTNFEKIAEKIFQESEKKTWNDEFAIYSQFSGLAEELKKLQVIGQPTISDQEKVRMLLQIQNNVLSQITDRTAVEDAEAEGLKVLLNSSNPLSNGPSLCMKILCVVIFMILVLLQGLTGSGATEV